MLPELAPVVLQCLQVLAAFCSAFAAYHSFKVARENKRYTRDATNRSAAAKHEEMIASHPELLALHGADPALLIKMGISDEEAAYLISSFTAGELYYTDGEIKELTHYRKTLLKSEKVRAFWEQILDNRLIGPSRFSTMVNDHIHQVYPQK